MPKSKLSPHDRFIRQVMSHPNAIQEFFSHHLPDSIQKIIDFSSITPQKDSFVDDKLRLQIADLLYAVNFDNEPGYLYLLLEHASSPDKLLPFRMLKYMIAIMEHHLKKTKSSTLPLIYPLILYTGKKPYAYSMDLFDLFESNKDLANDIWGSPFHLIDLTQAPDDILKRYLWFGTAALIAKHIHDPDILSLFKAVLPYLRNLAMQGEEDYIFTVISYVVEAGEVSDTQEFVQTIKGLEISEENHMTIADKLRQEGFEKGIEKGAQQGFEQAAQAIKILRDGASLEEAVQTTGLSVRQIEKIKKELA